jgi:hypothetical protein
VTYAGTIAEGFNQEVNGDASRVFCIPLMSAVIGSMQQKYLPAGAMARTHLTLELTLGDVEKIQDGNRPWAVKDVEYVAEMIHLDPMVDRELLAVKSGGIVVPFSTYSQHRWIASNGSGSMSMAFSSPYKSIKTLFAMFRKDESSYDAKPYVTKRANPIGDIGRYQFTINGVLTPSKPVEGNSEVWAEVMKAFHAYGAIDHIGKLTTADWTVGEGKYLIGCDIERHSHKSIFAQNCVDVSTSVSHLTAQFNAQLTSSLTVDVFSHYYNFIVIGPDGLVNVAC